MLKIFKMKKVRIVTTILTVLGIAVLIISLTLSGRANSQGAAAGSQTYTVTKGNLSLEISAAGNLALSETEDLAFNVAGTVLEVMVKAGDTVTPGQELATLDTTEWDEQLKTLGKAVVTAQRNLDAKENEVINAQRQVASLERQTLEKESAVMRAERQVTARELAVREAELAVESAEEDLDNIKDVQEAQAAIDGAETQLELIKMILRGIAGGGLQVTDGSYWSLQKTNVTADLADARLYLQDLLDGSTTQVAADAALQIAQASLQIDKKKLALEDARIALNDVELDVEDAKIAVDDAKYAVEEAKVKVETTGYAVDDAESTLDDARIALDEANSLSPVITAPFDGFISKINVQGGDEVLKGTVAMQIADANRFEAEIAVSEIDISQVELDGNARVEVDALGVTLPATVTYIAPTATVQSGVVNYGVTVEVQSLTASTAAENTTSQPPVGLQNTARQAGPSAQMTTGSLENVQLKAGMTATVSLIVSERQNVLLVPYSAITTEGAQKYVQVQIADGVAEKRVITTGITNYSFTEVTDGLAEGEQVLISTATTAAKSTAATEEQQPGGGMMIPSMGGGPPPGGPQ